MTKLSRTNWDSPLCHHHDQNFEDYQHKPDLPLSPPVIRIPICIDQWNTVTLIDTVASHNFVQATLVCQQLITRGKQAVQLAT
ncbi:hypothetical protein PR048_012484 [Dryococelus australis]|uniref:Uncharacterized protein n=1 Tax=Dryococelus australis TaxID=614101 RepID=A0ABQ9HPJ0_9NEOP|nr:hypothetical protein PR048_012484 [Dryococelus australis]